MPTASPLLPIGLFDSGVGGLTVARRLAELVPAESLLYFGDSARCPYGSRPLAEVREFGLQILDVLRAEGVKLVVVACNTSTAAGVPEAAAGYPFPVLGIIQPGARLAAQSTRSGRVGVVATQGTVASGAYQRALHAEHPDLIVTAQACPAWVPLVEAGRLAGPETEAAVAECLAPLLAAGIDTLVLGCTHYPALAPVIQKLAGPDVRLVDPAEEVARQAVHWLRERDLLRPADGTAGGSASGAGVSGIPGLHGEHRFLTSGDPEQFAAASEALWPGEVRRAEPVPMPL